MSHRNPHYFPDDTPEPVAEPYGTACALLDDACLWFSVAASTASLALVVYLAFPSVFNLFR